MNRKLVLGLSLAVVMFLAVYFIGDGSIVAAAAAAGVVLALSAVQLYWNRR